MITLQPWPVVLFDCQGLQGVVKIGERGPVGEIRVGKEDRRRSGREESLVRAEGHQGKRLRCRDRAREVMGGKSGKGDRGEISEERLRVERLEEMESPEEKMMLRQAAGTALTVAATSSVATAAVAMSSSVTILQVPLLLLLILLPVVPAGILDHSGSCCLR